ncbi:MAG TPA: HNH endonuclease signature motif containing protein [Pirellulales bacterium]|nr:HNH endonuclease signature motif containing protein [Pirellulales bacterium]
MDAALDRRVRERANDCCEYCRLPQSAYKFRFPVDHIIARQHAGETTFGNLCLACPRCNASKGPNIASVNSDTGKIVSLFNPRRHKWRAHFTWAGPGLQGKTAIGRATIAILAINHPAAIAVRQALLDEGVFPPG